MPTASLERDTMTAASKTRRSTKSDRGSLNLVQRPKLLVIAKTPPDVMQRDSAAVAPPALVSALKGSRFLTSDRMVWTMTERPTLSNTGKKEAMTYSEVETGWKYLMDVGSSRGPLSLGGAIYAVVVAVGTPLESVRVNVVATRGIVVVIVAVCTPWASFKVNTVVMKRSSAVAVIFSDEPIAIVIVVSWPGRSGTIVLVAVGWPP